MGASCSKANKLQRERDEAEDLEAKLADEAKFAEAVNTIREEQEMNKVETPKRQDENESEPVSVRSEKSSQDLLSTRSSKEILLEKQQTAQKEFEKMKREEQEKMEGAKLVTLDKADSGRSESAKAEAVSDCGTQLVGKCGEKADGKDEEKNDEADGKGDGKTQVSTLFNMSVLDKATSLVGQKYGCSLGPGHVTSECPICGTFDLSDAPLLS